MGTICRPSDSDIRGTEATAFIQYIDGQGTQIHELWCLGWDEIIRKVHPTAHVEVTYGTVRKFVTNHLAENRCIIKIIGQLSFNDSVKMLFFLTSLATSYLSLC